MKISSTSERLNELMRLYNIKQSDIVSKTGLDKSTISCYVSGRRVPAQDNIFIISNAYNLDPAWLMGYEVPMNKTTVSTNYEEEYKKIRDRYIALIKDEQANKFFDLYLELTDEQKESVARLVESMLPKPKDHQ